MQVTYVRSSETQNVFLPNTPLALVPSFQYTFVGGQPTTLPTADACVVRSNGIPAFGHTAFITLPASKAALAAFRMMPCV